MGRDRRLKIREWTLRAGELWVISGEGGCGKSTLARIIAEPKSIPGLSRHREANQRVAWISFDREQEIRNLLRHNDDSEYLGMPDEGTDLGLFLGGSLPGNREASPLSSGNLDCNEMMDEGLLRKLTGRGIKNLSTGEFRQVLIAREMRGRPALAVLDEPFEGLDVEARSRLMDWLARWMKSGTLIVLTVNRLEDIPSYATGLALLQDDEMVAKGAPEILMKSPEAARCFGRNRKKPFDIPPPPWQSQVPTDRLIELTGVSLAFNGRSVLEDVNWKVKRGESWLLSGPNGSGKTSLLNLIDGDEPRGYGQDIRLFGRLRGSGETTADIKSFIGLVSTSLQESAPKHADSEEILGSGLRDSLVLTRTLDGFEMDLVQRWLEVLEVADRKKTPFHRLSYTDRRVLLIGRAMIKHPPLLLLDEPMHGLDIIARARVSDLVDRLIKSTNTSVIFVSHRMEDAPKSINHHIRLVPGNNGEPSRAIIEKPKVRPGVPPYR